MLSYGSLCYMSFTFAGVVCLPTAILLYISFLPRTQHFISFLGISFAFIAYLSFIYQPFASVSRFLLLLMMVSCSNSKRSIKCSNIYSLIIFYFVCLAKRTYLIDHCVLSIPDLIRDAIFMAMLVSLNFQLPLD